MRFKRSVALITSISWWMQWKTTGVSGILTGHNTTCLKWWKLVNLSKIWWMERKRASLRTHEKTYRLKLTEFFTWQTPDDTEQRNEPLKSPKHTENLINTWKTTRITVWPKQRNSSYSKWWKAENHLKSLSNWPSKSQHIVSILTNHQNPMNGGKTTSLKTHEKTYRLS